MDQVVSNIKSLVGSSKNGVALINLSNEYRTLTGQRLDYQQFNFPSIVSLIKSVPDLVTRDVSGNVYVFLRPSDDSETLSNLVQLIQSTKNSKKNRGGGNMMGPMRNMNINSQQNSQKLQPFHPHQQQHHQQQPFHPHHQHQQQQQPFHPHHQPFHPLQQQYQAQYQAQQNHHATPQHLLPTPLMQQPMIYGGTNNNATKLMAPNDFRQFLDEFGNFSITSRNDLCEGDINPPSNGSQKENYEQDYAEFIRKYGSQPHLQHVGSTTAAGAATDSCYWLCHPQINYNPNRNVVKLLGIQSGNALIKSANFSFTANMMRLNKLVSGWLPGDFIIWQPPISSKLGGNDDCIDLNSAFVVVILRRIKHQEQLSSASSGGGSSSSVLVRLHGWKQTCVVSIGDLYKLPDDREDLGRMFSQIRSRQVTMVPLLGVDESLDLWGDIRSTNTYTAVYSVEEKCYLLEDVDNAGGNFLNIDITHRFLHDIASTFELDRRRVILHNVLDLVDWCLEQIVPCYLSAVAKETQNDQSNKESTPLTMIYNETNCDGGLILVGCKDYLQNKLLPQVNLDNNSSRRDVGRQLQRLIYDSDSHVFRYMDHRDSNSSNDAEPDVKLVSPIEGVFVINREFVRNKTFKSEKLRYQLALLMRIPGRKELLKLLNIDA